MKIIQACKQKCPWWLKVTLKMILYRLPVSQKFWRFFGVFEPGAMANCEYAYNQFHSHFKATKQTIQAPFTSLELGPGDSLFSGLVANALGAEKCWLINSGDLAIDDPTSYKAMINFLADKGYQTPDILVNANISEFLKIGRAHV